MSDEDIINEWRAYQSELRDASPLSDMIDRTIALIVSLRAFAGAVSHDQLSFANIKKTAKSGNADSKTAGEENLNG